MKSERPPGYQVASDTTQTKPSAAFPRVYDIHATSSCFVSVILIEIDQSYQNLLQAVLSLVVVHAVRDLKTLGVNSIQMKRRSFHFDI